MSDGSDERGQGDKVRPGSQPLIPPPSLCHTVASAGSDSDFGMRSVQHADEGEAEYCVLERSGMKTAAAKPLPRLLAAKRAKLFRAM